jgi:cysteine desulfurase
LYKDDVAIYLDHAATTRVRPEVATAMVECLREDYGNPSSSHALGRRAAARLATARAEIAAALGGAGDVVFTSGGTEADVLGVLGAAQARHARHVVVSAFEHPAVLGAAERLAAAGCAVSHVPVSADGLVEPDAVAGAVRADTDVVACMRVQNELGTLQPIAEIARAVRARSDAHIHCDAVQALGKVAIDAGALGVDSLAVSAHKLGGPKGTGALWLAPGARVASLWHGGGQEGGRRGGTENVAGAVGFAVAARLALARLPAADVGRLLDRLVARVLAGRAGARVVTGAAPRVPHIVALAVPGVTPAALEARGVIVSGGAACHGAARSHVLEAIGFAGDGILRVSLSYDSTTDDVDAAAQALIEA